MEVFIIIGLILLNGILSMSEIAMVSARKPRLEADAKRGSRAAKTALKLSGNPDVFLSTIQIGITLIGILTGIYSGDMLAQSFGKVLARIPALEAHSVAIAQVIIVVTVTYLTLILGELVPKRIGMSSSERVAKIVARPMSLLSKIALPFVWLLSKSTAGMLRILGINTVDGNRVTEEEIKAIIQEGAAEGEIEEVEQDIVERVFNLSDRNVGSIMTHRSDMVWLDTNATCDQVEDIVKNNLFNTYPVADGNLDSIVGVVHLKDLFGRLDEPGFTLSQVMRPAQYIPENLSVYNALDLMRRTGGRYGLVTDEFGSIEGIVTLKDIIKALLGSMPEAGEEQEIVTREDGSLLIDGQLSFYDFLAHFDMEDLYNDYNYNTLSGLILEKLEHIPHTGRETVVAQLRLRDRRHGRSADRQSARHAETARGGRRLNGPLDISRAEIATIAAPYRRTVPAGHRHARSYPRPRPKTRKTSPRKHAVFRACRLSATGSLRTIP